MHSDPTSAEHDPTGKPDQAAGSRKASKRNAPKARRESATQPALVIVESPAKARTIAKYLGPHFTVESSIGHIRDLPSSAAEIPAEYKEETWSRIGVDVEDEFRPLYIVPAKKKKQVTKLKRLLGKAGALYLATDEDREGEAIAWHLREVLEPKVPVKRMVFDEITKAAIQGALANPRDLDMPLVNAQEARRILDRLYGYEVSPVLWRKVGPKLSAGRVQSVATRLIVQRERQRMRFVAAEYWDVEATLQPDSASGTPVRARLIELAGRRIATGQDFDDKTGKLPAGSNVKLLDDATTHSLVQQLASAAFTVREVMEKPFTQRSHPPFITSTLQQEAARKLRFTVQRTMRLAQTLYENGYITYMRTDSTNLSNQAIRAARDQVNQLYGSSYLPEKPRVYATKAKRAQEAHEAIRPAGSTFRMPKELQGALEPDALKLYELIWKRTMACQMKDATGKRTTVRTAAEAGPHGLAIFTASGKVITFPGFLRAYVEGADDPEAELEDQERLLPLLRQGQSLTATKIEPKPHVTLPRARFTEASLIKELEDRGIGRPSTYATIIQTIQDRGYVWKKGTALIPTFTAFAVTNLLEKHFADLVDFGFTARMEDDLDAIASGRLASGPWLNLFYFGDPSATNGQEDLAHIGLKRRIGSGWEEIDAREISTISIGTDEQGRAIAARIGRYGPYLQVADTDQRATIPPDLPPDELDMKTARQLLAQAAQGDQVLGQDPDTGKPIYLKNGRFGPYVQLGDPERTEKGALKSGTKPRMASLWPSMTPDTVTLEDALMLLSFPKTLGVHPEKGEPVTVQDGRYGPYVKMGSETRSLADHEQLLNTTLAEALELLAQPKRGRGRGGQATLLKLGHHPESNAPLEIKSGRFGPYVTDGVVNASLPKNRHRREGRRADRGPRAATPATGQRSARAEDAA